MKIIDNQIVLDAAEASEYVLTSRYVFAEFIVKNNNISMIKDDDGTIWFKETELSPIRAEQKAKGASITYFPNGAMLVDTISPRG